MLTVPEAARRVGRNPETVRRWIRSGRLAAHKIGTQHVIEEEALAVLVAPRSHTLPAPAWWDETESGRPMPDWVALLHRQRTSH